MVNRLYIYLPLALTHFQVTADDVAACLIIILMSHYGILPHPVDIPDDISEDVVRQQNKLQPQNVNNAGLLIAATAQSNIVLLIRLFSITSIPLQPGHQVPQHQYLYGFYCSKER